MIDGPPDEIPFWFEEVSGESSLCNSSRIVFSPSGDYVALWSRRDDPALAPMPTGGPAFVQIAETDCFLADEQPCRAWRVGSPSTFNGVFWSPDNRLIMTPAIEPIRAWTPPENTTHVVLRQTPWRDWSKFQLTGPAGADQLTGVNELPDLEAKWRIGSVSIWRGAAYGAALDRSDHRLALFEDDGAGRPRFIHLALSAHWVGEKAAWAHDSQGRSYLVGGGAFHRIDGDHLRPALPHLVHPEGVFDAVNGDLEGAFDDDEIVLLDGRSAPQAPEGLDFYAHVAVHSGRGLLGRVWKAVDGRHHIRIETQDGAGRTIDCWRPSGAPAHDVSTENWGTEQRPVDVRRARLLEGARGTVVIFRGGPGGTVARGGSASAETWLHRGYDTVSVEATGADGPEFFGRLKSEGVEAFKRDAAVVAGRLAAEDASVGLIVVEGTSFGAIAAAETARELSRLRAGRTALLLFVPWLVHRNPGDISDGYGPAPLNPDFVRLSEAARFGPMRADGTGFADAMDRWRSTFGWEGPTLVILGEGDALSRESDLWADAKHVDVRTYPGGHRFAGFSAEAQAEIAEWLAGLR